MNQQSHKQPRRPMGSYWPQAGIVVGLMVNLVGAALMDYLTFTFGTNILVLSTAFAVQRSRNDRRPGDD